MAETQSYAEQNKARLKEITDKIEIGIREVYDSERYRQYLRTMSRFPRYSVNNQMLIYLQRPDATHVCGYNRWRDQFGRNVLKGEKGIRIIAPTPFKKKIEQEKLDPNTKLPMLDMDGNVVMEEKTIQIPMFKVVSVFDLSQTDGKPLPELAASLTGDVHHFDAFMEALRRSSPVPIVLEAMPEDMDGYFSTSKQQISIRMGMSERQTVSAVVHEIAHAKLHNLDRIGEEYENIELFEKPALFSNNRVNREELPDGLYCYDLRGSDYDPGMPITLENHVGVNHAASIITAEPIEIPEQGFLRLGDDGLNFLATKATIKEFFRAAFPEKAKVTRAAEELQAESISYAVCAYYGIETGENSFGYLASWADGKGMNELRASLETINKAASALITDIDQHFAEIVKERGLNEALSTPDYEAAFLSHAADSYAIYQLRDQENTANLHFMNSDYLNQNDLAIKRDNYIAVYAGALGNTGTAQETLDSLYQRFNVGHPDDYRGHSLSVSDVVALKQGGEIASYYIDSLGFKEVPGFIAPENSLRNAEMSMEDDYGMLDGIINNGAKEKPSHENDEKKPSIREQLQRSQDKPKKAAPSKRPEMER